MSFNVPLRGFTLIELLVVIAIIGILATIVLVSLGSARQKGSDAGIQGNLNSIRTQAEVFAINNANDYGAQGVTTGVADAVCGTAGMWNDTVIKQGIINASRQAGSATLAGATTKASVCKSTASSWVLAVVKKDNVTAWCVDSTGRAKDVAVSALTAPYFSINTICP